MASLLILYHSQQYGNTEQMAMAVGEGAKDAGVAVVLHNTNDARYDIGAYRTIDAAAFGSPDYFSYIAGGLKVFLDDWYIAKGRDPTGLEDKPIALFYSHGGGGAARRPLEELFSRLGYQVGETVESLGAPSERILEACRTLGRTLAKAMS